MLTGFKNIPDFKNLLIALQRGPLIFLIVGWVLILVMLGVNSYNTKFGTNAMAELQTRRVQMDRLDRLLRMMLDVETGVRGYLLMHSTAYLEPYNKNIPLIPDLLNDLERNFSVDPDDRRDVAKLRQLVKTKLDWLGTNVKAGHPVIYVESGEAGPGKAFMDEIRDLEAGMRARHDQADAQLFVVANSRFEFIQGLTFALASSALAAILCLFLILNRRDQLRRRLANLLATENGRLEASVAQRTEELTQLASYLTNAREAERERLARELHDELGALLTAVRMDVRWLQGQIGPESDSKISERLTHSLELIGSCITIKRRIIDDLRPALLQDLGLVETLNALVVDFSREVPVRITLADDVPNLAEPLALAIYRIVQEAFTNIRKYAQAKNVVVELALGNAEIRLVVADDGVGFDPESTWLNRHGLAGMKHRVQMFNGQFSVVAAPGRGTRIEVRLPLLTA